MTILIAGTVEIATDKRDQALAGATEDLPAQLSGPHYAQMPGLLGKYEVSEAEASRFRIALEAPVHAARGTCRADFFNA